MGSRKGVLIIDWGVRKYHFEKLKCEQKMDGYQKASHVTNIQGEGNGKNKESKAGMSLQCGGSTAKSLKDW